MASLLEPELADVPQPSAHTAWLRKAVVLIVHILSVASLVLESEAVTCWPLKPEILPVWPTST